MKHLNKILSLILLSQVTNASMLSNAANDYFLPNNTRINASLDDENNILPDLYIPINWSKNISSDIEFKQTKDFARTSVDGNYDDSDEINTIKSEVIHLHLLKYNTKYKGSPYSFSIGYTSESYDKNQIGFVNSGGNITNFNNNILIDVKGINGYLSTSRNFTKKLSAKFDFIFLAASTLNVSQNTEIENYGTGGRKSSESLELNYELRADFNYNLSSYIDFGFESRYKFLPMNYSLDLAYLEGFVNTYVKEKEKKIYNAFKLYFKNRYLERINIRPMMGYSYETTKNSFKSVNYVEAENDSSSDTVGRFIFGLNSKF